MKSNCRKLILRLAAQKIAVISYFLSLGYLVVHLQLEIVVQSSLVEVREAFVEGIQAELLQVPRPIDVVEP